MAFGSFNDDQHEMADINVTPLVDVMLVLLIVFMIAFPVVTSSVRINLPTSNAQADPPTEKNLLRVSITETGDYFVKEKRYTLDELVELMRTSYAENKNLIVALSADKKSSYDAVAKVLDAARKLGIQKVGFVMELKPDGTTSTP